MSETMVRDDDGRLQVVPRYRWCRSHKLITWSTAPKICHRWRGGAACEMTDLLYRATDEREERDGDA